MIACNRVDHLEGSPKSKSMKMTDGVFTGKHGLRLNLFAQIARVRIVLAKVAVN